MFLPLLWDEFSMLRFRRFFFISRYQWDFLAWMSLTWCWTMFRNVVMLKWRNNLLHIWWFGNRVFSIFSSQATKRRKSQRNVVSSDVAEHDVNTGKSFSFINWPVHCSSCITKHVSYFQRTCGDTWRSNWGKGGFHHCSGLRCEAGSGKEGRAR